MNLTEIFKGKDSETATASRKATDLLKEDHQKVKSLFHEFRGLDEDADQEKARVFEEIRSELTVHAKVEEEIFYPAVKKLPSDEAKDLVLEAGEEHGIVKTLLEQLKKLDAGDDVFDAKMKVLMESVEHHADEEEREMFAEARKGLDEDALLALGARIEARKSELLATDGRGERKSPRSSGSATKQRKPARSAAAPAEGKSSGRSARSSGRTGAARKSSGSKARRRSR